MLAGLGQSLAVGERPFGTTGEAGIASCLKALAAFAVTGKHLQERPSPWRRRTGPAVPQIETPRLRLARLTEITRTWHKPKMSNFFLQPINTKHFTTSFLTFGIGLAFLFKP